jgi:G3E family GTPase
LTDHESFVAQTQIADVLVLSHHTDMSVADQQQWALLLAALPTPERTVYTIDYGALTLAEIDLPRRTSRQTRRSLLHSLPTGGMAASSPDAPTLTLPYHYVEQGMGQEVGGWRLPVDWLFDRDAVLLWLMSLQDWLRIKGVIHTQHGWLSINLIPQQIGLTSHSGGSDNRLEIINAPNADWVSRETALLACVLSFGADPTLSSP